MPEVWPGDPSPLGATWDVVGTNFSVFSSVATGVDVCLFDEDGTETLHPLTEVDGHRWHGYLYGVGPGARYGFRVHGPYDPAHGARCNPSKLLLDPYAKAVDGAIEWHPALSPYVLASADDRLRDVQDSAPFMPKSVVLDRHFDWAGDRQLRTPWHRTVIYETHVKGLTATHPSVPEAQRGTYAGVAHPAVIEHLTTLGVTAVDLLPVHQFIDEGRVAASGLRNYWGYNPICYLAPHNGYSAGDGQRAVTEFKEMVRALHTAGLEVILDVVYNHTAEGDHLGPMFAFRGLDNARYYRLDPADPGRYWDTTGCGNTVDAGEPFALQLIMDSLRYWVTDMHVDGFRFDLAATLTRQSANPDRRSAFLDLVQQDPVVSEVKLIAEPWDLGEAGYQLGNFPPLWSEWNGKFRDGVRDYWREHQADLGEVAQRLTGSPDLFNPAARRPRASVNFVTAHDGFTLRDLVSYNSKHNQANGEGNQDGTDDNRSWNCGAEGETDDLEILVLRQRQVRNFLATLFLSQGVPMLLGGDELGRTQRGNNNAYCQDNEISWYDWAHVDDGLIRFTRRLIALRGSHPVFRQPAFLDAANNGGIAWYKPDGTAMASKDWATGYARSLAMYLDGGAVAEVDRQGVRLQDDSFYLLFNAWDQPLAFVLPLELPPFHWDAVVDTAIDGQPAGSYRPGDKVALVGRHAVVLQSRPAA
ncbi:MAG: glycogen debranching protein GlgX [Acidimicrobiales bacterium]